MADIIIYNTADGKAEIKLYADNGTVWLTQAQIVDLFNSSKSSISEHIKNIFSEDELDENSVVRKIRTTAADGKNYLVSYYSLDVILAVGFRVRSPRGTQFRQWANNTLKEYLQKGFILDKDRLKNPDGRPDYFDELLEQIRDIRASENVFIRSCVTYSLSPATTKLPKEQRTYSLQTRKTNCFLASQEKLLLKL